MNGQHRSFRSSQLIWLIVAVLSAVVVLAPAETAQGASPPTTLSNDDVIQVSLGRPVPDLQQTLTIPLYVNPSRRVLNPGDEVLLSVGDDWLQASLTWDSSWASDDSWAGGLSATRGPYVYFTAPYDSGRVAITVNGRLYGRSGSGTVYFSIQG